MKKVISILLTASMATSMTVPIFAAEQLQSRSIPHLNPKVVSALSENKTAENTQIKPADKQKDTQTEQKNDEAAKPEAEQSTQDIPAQQEAEKQVEADTEQPNPAENAETKQEPAQTEQKAEAVATPETETAPEMQEGQADDAEKEAAASVVYEHNRMPFSSIKGATASSEKSPAVGNDGPASHAFDGDSQTIWHTNYGSGVNATLPVTIEWSVGDTAKKVGKIVYQKRQGSPNGVWTKIDVAVKNGATSEYKTVLSDFVLDEDAAKTEITFTPEDVTHIRVTVKESAAGAHASAAEIITYEAVEVAQVIPERQALREAYADAQFINQDKYSTETVQVLKDALTKAEQVLADKNSTQEQVVSAASALQTAIDKLAPSPDKIVSGKPASGTTHNNPFPVPVGGSKQVRIPSIITLKNGHLAAAIDARWNHHADHGNIDTLFSISKDNGKTWTYQFPNFFNDSAPEVQDDYGVPFIDPVMIQGEDGTIYLLVDVFPGGTALNSSAPRHPSQDTGYVEIDGKQRMVLYKNRDGQTTDNYDYYVGDYNGSIDGKKIAPVIAKGDASKTPQYYIDDHFYLYTLDKKPMYNEQLGTDKFVHQNVFFHKANLHVREATFLYLITSKDEGQTWSAPNILNPQIHPGNISFFGVGPGAGLSFVDAQGTNVILLPTYVHPNEHSSFIYSSDNGTTWKHSEQTTPDHSSESVLVQLDENTVRQFTRDNGHSEIRYTDFEWNPAKKTFSRVKTEKVAGTHKTVGNQVSAIRYSKLVNGKPAILVSTATGEGRTRKRGKIYTLTVEADKTMKVFGEPYQVNTLDDDYAYSSLTETKDGNIALLYESPLSNNYIGEGSVGEAQFVMIEKEKLHLTDDVLSENQYVLDLTQYQTIDGSLAPVPSAADIAKVNAEGKVFARLENGKVFYTALQTGTQTIQYQKNGKEISLTLRVTPDTNIKQKDIYLDVGQKYHMQTAGPVRFKSNPDVLSVTQSPITIETALGQTGSNRQYDGAVEALTDAAYTFKKVAGKENVYTMQATTQEGETIYFAGVAAKTSGQPFSKEPQEVTIESNKENEFSFYQGTTSNKGYLWFWKNDATKLRFDRNSKYVDNGNMDFELYQVNPQTRSNDLFGFTRVMSLSDIQDGGQYIIVAATNDGSRYVLRPSTDSNHYSHVLKSKGKGPLTTGYNTTLQLLKAGTGVVVIDDTAYHVSVKGTASMPNTSALADEVRISESLDLTKFQNGTEKNNFVEALRMAKQILQQPSQYTQEQVNAAASKLSQARLALKKVDSVTPAPAPTPTPATKPNTPATSPTQTKTSAPQTGDNTPVGVLASLAAVSAGALGILGIKKRKKK